MDFISCFKEAETIHEKIMCFIAKLLKGKYVTPLGRVILLPSDYREAERIYKLHELYPH